MKSVRKLEKGDFPLINQAIVERRWERYSKEWTALIDPRMVRAACFGEHPTIKARVLFDTYLFLYQVVVPWYTTKPILEESLLFLINKVQKGNFHDVVQAMKEIAAKNQCHMISVGTAMADDRIYGRLLERNGFTQQARGYTLMLPPPSSVN